MGKVAEQLLKTEKFKCDKCGEISELLEHEKQTWYFIDCVFNEKQNLLLLEKPNKYHYESFHVPNKELKTFCSLQCARDYLQENMILFLASLKPSKDTTKRTLI